MSDYPPASHYGAHYGPPDQNRQQPPYPPPPFPNQYPHPNPPLSGNYPYQMPSSNLENTQAAYGYNQGLSNGPPSLSHPLSAYPGWPAEPITHQPYPSPHTGVPETYQNAGYYNPQVYAPPPPSQAQQPYIPYNRSAEEGELSEGEFDYNSHASASGNFHGTNSWSNDGSGFLDTAQRAVYARNQDRNVSSQRPAHDYDYGHNSPQTRQASDSYSPNASPAQGEYEPLRRDKRQNNMNPGGNKSSQKGGRMTPKSKQAVPASTQPQNGTQRSTSTSQHSKVRGTPEPKKPQTQLAVVDAHPDTAYEGDAIGNIPSQHPGLIQARKDAQTAAEELSRLGDAVSMQVLIAEGLSEALIRKYFRGLKGLTSSSTHAVAAQKDSQVSTNGASAGSVAASTTKPAGPTEKERTLQLKMEALRKSREERAQKNAAKTNVSAPSTEHLNLGKPASPSVIPLTSATSNPPVQEPQPSQNSEIKQVDLAATNSAPLPQPNNTPLSSAQPSQLTGIPGIPGLFLNSSTTNAIPSAILSNGEAATAAPPASRKRPVAADFDTPSFVAPKRPFGHSRTEKPLVIDVSDEEGDSDEDVAMDLESQHDQNSPIQSARTLMDSRAATINSLPQLSDFPLRKALTTPPSVSDTTPPAYPSATKSILGKPEDLQRKMQEIADMKRRIADAEKRKKAKQNSSGANTPRRMESNGSESGRVENIGFSSKVEAAIQIDRLVTMAESKANKDHQKLADAQLAESEKAAELESVEAEQKRLRHEKLTKDLPLVDAGVLQKQNQLAQLQAEMKKIQAAIDKDLADKQRIIEERERLGQEAESQLQEQKEKLRDLNKQVNQNNTVSSLTTPGSHELDGTTHPSHAITDQSKSPVLVVANTEQQINESTATQVQRSRSASALIRAGSDSPRRNDDDADDLSEKMDIESVATPDEILEAALQEAVRAEVEAHLSVNSEPKSPDVEMEDSYAPDPSQLEPDHASSSHGSNAGQSPLASPVLKRDQNKGIDRDSDDYEPPDATPTTDAFDEYEPPEATPSGEIHDDYEPPEASPIPDAPSADLSAQPLHESRPFSPVSPEVSVDQSKQAPAGSPAVTSLSIGNHEQDTTDEMISPQRHVLRKPVAEKEADPDSNEIPATFTPYESPLKQFRAYRFHPDFKKDVPGGYRSITYSHKSDPNQELCRYELAGGFCNDGDCDLQHFRNIGLSDNDILASLTSHTEFSGEQRGKFISGLKQVFADLREKNLDKDFETIASALVAHRAQFLGDSSKVLMLEGTSI
ncbi:hypothetical protein PVAG01_06844 [Phlyctema vagabunda]|uniref:C3H1-type domain-containing protein n=1 Tax=Phlyctema vagabunda TaxID=108571 RepID=A0ABR4PH97_9HELO